jgi:inhibitor of cysteine peptidase
VKRLLILLVVAATCVVAGCVGEVKTYTDPGQTIDIGVNQEFVIALGSNLTTGYSWQASYDETMLELVGGQSTYKLSEEAKEGVVGAGGVEYFRFKALKTERTKITLVYKRPWEEEILDQKVFTINIR